MTPAGEESVDILVIVKEITMANDGIVNQRAVLAYARESFGMIQELESWGVKFQKTPSGDYDVKKVHHKGSYVLPMPEGYDIKKILGRVIRQTGVKVAKDGKAVRGAFVHDRETGRKLFADKVWYIRKDNDIAAFLENPAPKNGRKQTMATS